MTIFTQNRPLKPLNTFGIEATARLWAEFSNTSELIEIIKQCKAEKLEWTVLSGGSNIILTNTFEGVYLHPTGRGIAWNEHESELVVEAGLVWDDLVEYCCREGLWGLECLSYIPGLVGASPVQNIGAYGAEAGDLIKWVEYLDTNTLEIKRINGCDCQFGYRSSLFKTSLKGVAIVTAVAFGLSKERPQRINIDYGLLAQEVEKRGGVTLQNIRESVIEIRQSKLPDPNVTGNAGSFFKNPVVEPALAQRIREQYPNMPSFEVAEGVKIPAGWLIDTAGWKGRRVGNVGVHHNQALVIVNHGGGDAEEILSLAERICQDVEEMFGISLQMEVNIL